MTRLRVTPGPCARLVYLACIKIMEMALFRPPMRAPDLFTAASQKAASSIGRDDACHEFRLLANLPA
jgi:hypothetical protein